MADIKITVFWDVVICNMTNRCQYFKGACLSLQNGSRFSTLMMEVAEPYKTMVFIYQTSWHHILEDHNLETACAD
jgi:hypothetical protein